MKQLIILGSLVISVAICVPLLNAHARYVSQMGQDQFVYEQYFTHKKDGVFVDIGAYDGVSGSNTYFFEHTLGWKGICFEPLPEVYEELCKNRTCVCIKACVANTEGTGNFLHVKGYAQMLSGLIDTYDSRHMARINYEMSTQGGSAQMIQVAKVRLNAVLAQEGIAEINYLSIDVEGAEMEVLRSIDFNAVTIDVISVENNYNDPQMSKLLAKHGFVLVHRFGGFDDLYVHRRLLR